MPTLIAISSLGIAAVIWLGGGNVIDGSLTEGELVAFISYMTMVSFPMIMFAFIQPMISAAGASMARISEVLAEERVRLKDVDAGTAIFYSISNCQRGLAGVSFGNFLIKQVVAELRLQLPQLSEFRTLSPVPGLMRWVNHGLPAADEAVPAEESADVDEGQQRLQQALQTARRIAAMDPFEQHDKDNEQLSFLVAHYLRNEKRSDNLPMDPVARFHLGNGASLDIILSP